MELKSCTTYWKTTLTLTSHQHHDLTLFLPLPGFPHKNAVILKHDLPSNLSVNEKSDLKSIYCLFMDEVESLEPARDALSEIDEYCKVLDPDPPKPGHLYRQIVLKSGVFLQIRINPEDAFNLPQLTFIGLDEEVQQLRANQAENVSEEGMEGGATDVTPDGTENN